MLAILLSLTHSGAVDKDKADITRERSGQKIKLVNGEDENRDITIPFFTYPRSMPA
jgi:hypothetical protein